MKSANEDQLLKSLFKQSEEQAPQDLTEHVMQRIEHSPSSSVFEYQPVISKRGWLIIASVFLLSILFVIFHSSGFTLEMPMIVALLESSFVGLSESFRFEFKAPELPQIPTTILVAIAALNVVGIYLMISYKWEKRLFR